MMNLENRVQTVPRRNLFAAMEEEAKGSAPAPVNEYVTREDLETAEKRIAETVQNALQQFVQQRQVAPATPPEEDERRSRMRSMAD